MYKTKFTLVKFSFPVFLQPTVGTVGSTKKGNCQNKIDTFLQLLHSGKPSYERWVRINVHFISKRKEQSNK
jgi:hypothetical protein